LFDNWQNGHSLETENWKLKTNEVLKNRASAAGNKKKAKGLFFSDNI